MCVVDRKAFHSPEITHEATGERSVIHVRARDDPRGGHLLIGGTALHYERGPLAQFALILGIFHALVAMMGRHRCKALCEERDVVRAVHEAHMGDRMDEGLRVRDCPLLHQIGPKLARRSNSTLTFSASEMSMLPSLRSGV